MTWLCIFAACFFVALSTWATIRKRWVIVALSGVVSTVLIFVAGNISTEKGTEQINRSISDSAASLSNTVKTSSEQTASQVIDEIRKERDKRLMAESLRADQAIRDIETVVAAPNTDSKPRISQIASNYFNSAEWVNDFMVRRDQVRLESAIRVSKVEKSDLESKLKLQVACDDAKPVIKAIISVIKDMLDQVSIRTPGIISYNFDNLHDIRCDGEHSLGNVIFATNAIWTLKVFSSSRPLQGQDVELVLRVDIAPTIKSALPRQGWIDVSILRPNGKYLIRSSYEGISEHASSSGEGSEAVEDTIALIRDLMEIQLSTM